MQKQTYEFAIVRKNGNITRIGKSNIYQPKPNFKGGSVKWLKDRPKQKSS